MDKEIINKNENKKRSNLYVKSLPKIFVYNEKNKHLVEQNGSANINDLTLNVRFKKTTDGLLDLNNIPTLDLIDNDLTETERDHSNGINFRTTWKENNHHLVIKHQQGIQEKFNKSFHNFLHLAYIDNEYDDYEYKRSFFISLGKKFLNHREAFPGKYMIVYFN